MATNEFVALACERAKDWLVAAVERGDIEVIVETRAQGEAIRIYTAQKNIGKDAERGLDLEGGLFLFKIIRG